MKLKQFSCILGLAIGIVAGNISKASALDFDFSFDNVDGNVSGTVTGTIYGLLDNTSNQQGVEVDLTSYPSGLGSNPNSSGNVVYKPLGVDWGNSGGSSFTVTNGQITFADFYETSSANGNGSALQIEYATGLDSYLTFDGGNVGAGNITSGNAITFTPTASVPFEFSPIQGMLFGVPLFIGLRMLKRKRAVNTL